MNKPVIVPFMRQTLSDALEGRSTTVLIAIADISNITEFCPISAKLPYGLSLIELKRGQQFPVKGTPEHIKEVIDAALA